MTADESAPKPAMRALAVRIAKSFLAPHWKGLAAALTCAVVVAGCTFLLISYIQPAMDQLLVRPEGAAILAIPLTMAAIAVVRGVFHIMQLRLINRIGHSVVAEIQMRLVRRLLRADLKRLQQVHTGSFVSQVLYDAGLLRETATNGVVTWVQHALTVIAMLAVMIWQDWALALIAITAGPFAAAVMKRYSQKTSNAARGAMGQTSALSTAIMESLDGIKIVKIENREAYEEKRVRAVVDLRQKFLIKGSNARSTSGPVTETLMSFVVAAVFAYAGWRSLSGAMTPGELTAFLVALAAGSQSMNRLASVQTTMSEGLTAANRLFEALDIEPEISDRPGAAPLPDGPSTIRLEEVVFAYGPDAPALNGVSLEAHKGETVALVGPSGGGKSTILNLIPRFYDVTGGRLTIDGHDVREVTLDSLRSRIALVTQEPFLFDESIRANIAYARPEASQAEIEAAALAAAAHDFITALPGGYEAMAGEAGVRLSGGQRQRIAIARAFLKNAPILLLDEATSALDTESEAQVQAALERLMSGRTTILIAHRLSTVRGADRIYVIDGGKVVETGDHLSLVKRGGLYARLAAAQDLDARTEAAE